MTNENKAATPKKKNTELIQLLLSVSVIGIFVLIEVWLIFFYCSRYGYDNSTFLFPLIFGILTILMVCLNTLNIYQIFVKRTSATGAAADKKAEYMIYKQVKALPDVFKKDLEQVAAEFEATQKKTAKVIVMKVDEQLKQFKEEMANQGTSDNGGLEQLEEVKAEIKDIKTQLADLNSQCQNLSMQLNAASSDHEDIKANFPDLQGEHKKVFDLLGSLTFRNDQIIERLNDIYDFEKEVVSIDDKFVPEEDNEELGLFDIETGKERVLEDISVDEAAVSEEVETVEDFAIEDLADFSESAKEDAAEEPAAEDILASLQADEDYDPNKQLSPEEISALFANV